MEFWKLRVRFQLSSVFSVALCLSWNSLKYGSNPIDSLFIFLFSSFFFTIDAFFVLSLKPPFTLLTVLYRINLRFSRYSGAWTPQFFLFCIFCYYVTLNFKSLCCVRLRLTVWKFEWIRQLFEMACPVLFNANRSAKSNANGIIVFCLWILLFLSN